MERENINSEAKARNSFFFALAQDFKFIFPVSEIMELQKTGKEKEFQ